MKTTTKASLLPLITLLAAFLLPTPALAATCSVSYGNNVVVTLTATAASGSRFSGWAGACAGAGSATCTLAMNVARSTTAYFVPARTLAVSMAGTGVGTVTSSPGGINCGIVCSALFNLDSNVTLAATPAASSSFTGWSGACAGAGTVTSSPAGISCGAACGAYFNQCTTVTLAAASSAGSTFTGWSGACTGTAATCTVTLSAAQTAYATFTAIPVPLAIATSGTGAGTVTSSPAGISCGATCTANFNQNSSVTLTAAPSAGSAFTGWSGACTGTAAACTVAMGAAQTVTANFNAIQLGLTVSKAGTGTGTITSAPGGIDCGATCTATFDQYSSVTLTAAPATGSSFGGWTGACMGTATACTVTMAQAQTVGAGFTLTPVALTVNKAGTGTGAVTSTPAGIDCGATYTADFTPNTAITLTATPAAVGTAFNGWTGACTGTAVTCTVTLSAAQTVSANFILAKTTLTVTKAGAGSGTVTSSPAGIDCGATCALGFDLNDTITLTATPANGSTFQGWQGACSGATSTCTVTVSQAKTAYAQFTASATSTFQYDPNGNLTQVTDPLGHVNQTQYDSLGQPTEQLEPHPTAIGSTLGQISTTYDGLGQVTKVTDPRNLETTYQMDNLGNLLSQTSPDTGTTQNTYDEAGNLKTRTDARGKVAAYSYDSQNRIPQVIYEDQTFTYTWDTCTNGIGRLCTLANGGATIGLNYDSHGRITNRTQTIGTIVQNTAYGYNAQGQLVQLATPGGNTIDYVWLNDRPQSITVNGQPLITQIAYEPDGQVAGWTWNNGSTSERLYDLTGKPIAINLGFDSQGQLPALRNYSYDAAGKVTGIFDGLDPSLDQTYGYDNLDRLISNQIGAFTLTSLGYSYDLSGNRTGKTTNNTSTEASAIDPGSNRLQQKTDGTQTTTYSYDPIGNQISDGTITYGYNAQGRRTTATTAANLNASYDYNALGQRVKKTVNGTSTLFSYTGQGQLQGEYNATGQAIQETVWLGSLPIAVLKPNATTTDVFYVHSDHLNTPRKISRPSDNKPAWAWEPEAFGNSPANENPGGLGNFTYNLRFPGQYYDQETGLNYNYYRDYDSANGRYTTSDPIGLQGGINAFAYVNGNPVNLIDPTGQNPLVLVPYIVPIAETGAFYCAIFPDKCRQAAQACVDGVTKMFNEAAPKQGAAGGEGAGKPFPDKVKERARDESGNTCVFCGTETTNEPGPTRSEIDHAIPKSRDGNNTQENAQNTCRTCNRQKGAQTTDEFLQ